MLSNLCTGFWAYILNIHVLWKWVKKQGWHGFGTYVQLCTEFK
jgi:hypothetical protein